MENSGDGLAQQEDENGVAPQGHESDSGAERGHADGGSDSGAEGGHADGERVTMVRRGVTQMAVRVTLVQRGVGMMCGEMLMKRYQLWGARTATRPILVLRGLKTRVLHSHHRHQMHRCGRRVCLVYLYLLEYQCVQLRVYHKFGGYSASY